jgi:deaminated glutathione amidase
MVLRAALVQMCSGRDVTQNREDMLHRIREAAGMGASYIQTPEMTSLVERDREALFAKIVPQDQDHVLAAAREEAKRLKVTIHLGSLAVRTDEKAANRAFLIGPDGEILARYDKIHLFDVDLPDGTSWRESQTYQAGDKPVLAPLPVLAFLPEQDEALIGLSICYDLRFPALYRYYGEQGAGLLTAPACFTKLTGEAHWHILQRARAIETGSFMLSAAQTGSHEDGRVSYGHSLIVDPWGRVLADGGTEPGIIIADLALDDALMARQRLPVLKQKRDFLAPKASCDQAASG